MEIRKVSSRDYGKSVKMNYHQAESPDFFLLHYPITVKEGNNANVNLQAV